MSLDIKEIGPSTENWILGVGGKDIIPSPILKSHLENSGSVIACILHFYFQCLKKNQAEDFYC